MLAISLGLGSVFVRSRRWSLTLRHTHSFPVVTGCVNACRCVYTMLLALAVARASSVSIVGREPSPTSCDDLRECRTLQDIIWSCLVTILLCTWVSLHPNIPGPHEQRAKPALRRVGLMVLALIAPELVISWAMRQRVAAGRLAAEHKSEFVKKPPTLPAARVYFTPCCRSWLDKHSRILRPDGRLRGLRWRTTGPGA
jgi:hypothetical protein